MSAKQPGKVNPTNHFQPNYITQDDKEHLANLLFNVALPQLNKAQQLDQEDCQLQQANLMHAKLYYAFLLKTQIQSTKTPLGINSQALDHLMGTHLENPHHSSFIPTTLQDIQQYSQMNANLNMWQME